MPCNNNQPLSHINTLPFAPTFSDSTTLPPVTLPIISVDNSLPTTNSSLNPITSRPSSSNHNKENFASLFKHSRDSSPILFAPIPLPYTKGNLPAIKIDESTYQKSTEACKLNLLGRFTLPKGASPVKTSELHTKLNARWNITNGFILTPIGKVFFCLRFKNQVD